MLFYCAFVEFLLFSSGLLTAIALPTVTHTITTTIPTNETDKQSKLPDEVVTVKIETTEPRVPTAASKLSLSNSSIEDEEEEEEEETGMDEMMPLRPCQVSDITYQHREQIPRSDPCEICVCVDSEMYCLWKLCPMHHKTTATPIPETETTKLQQTTKQSTKDNKTTAQTGVDFKENEIDVTNEKFTKILKDERKHKALKKLEATSPNIVFTGKTTTEKAVTSPSQPAFCYVMGVSYKLGEVLPRDTGTCLECSCSEGARVTCSPKNCVSQTDLDYLSHNNNIDMFDLDTF